jgi:hypothetical protein
MEIQARVQQQTRADIVNGIEAARSGEVNVERPSKLELLIERIQFQTNRPEEYVPIFTEVRELEPDSDGAIKEASLIFNDDIIRNINIPLKIISITVKDDQLYQVEDQLKVILEALKIPYHIQPDADQISLHSSIY